MMIRVIVIVAVLCLIFFAVTGCVTPEHQEQLDAKTKKLAEQEARLEEVYRAVLDGTLTVGEARTVFEEIRKDATELQAQINRFSKGGYSNMDIFLSILRSLATVAGSLGLTRVWRGSVLNRKGLT